MNIGVGLIGTTIAVMCAGVLQCGGGCVKVCGRASVLLGGRGPVAEC